MYLYSQTPDGCFSRMTQGFPMTMLLAGTSFITTAPAPMVTLSPMVMPPATTALVKTVTLSPMMGLLISRPGFAFRPMVTP